jgi:hypothetical protein
MADSLHSPPRVYPVAPPGLRPRGFSFSGGNRQPLRVPCRRLEPVSLRARRGACNATFTPPAGRCRPVSVVSPRSPRPQRHHVDRVLFGSGPPSRIPASGIGRTTGRVLHGPRSDRCAAPARPLQSQEPGVPIVRWHVRRLGGKGDRCGDRRRAARDHLQRPVRYGRPRDRRHGPRAGHPCGSPPRSDEGPCGPTALPAGEPRAQSVCRPSVDDPRRKLRSASAPCGLDD